MSKKEEKNVLKAERRAAKTVRKAEKKAAKQERKAAKSETSKWTSQSLKRLINRARATFSLQPVFIILAAAAALMLMTWLIRDVIGVEHIYAAAGFELIGVVIVLMALILPINIVLYRRRVREIVTLSEAISRVARGDFESRISTEKKTGITPIYEDFNLMCDELQSVKILRNDFINNYSHEFKTPIASIKGFAELLLEKDMTEEDKKRYLRIIADESDRLSNLASNTTLLSKLSTQQIISDMEVYDLGTQLRECAILLSGKWLGKDITIDCEEIPAVKYHGNKATMQHLWINLLDNSIKYTPEGGEILVSLAEEVGVAIIKITDTGEGISDETKARLFIPYFQGDASHSKEGLGLGLAIVMRIVELCKGSIEVDSKVGEGSTFTIRLPL